MQGLEFLWSCWLLEVLAFEMKVFPRPWRPAACRRGAEVPGGLRLCKYQVVNEREGEANICGLGAAL
jgi:hypothetical protein